MRIRRFILPCLALGALGLLLWEGYRGAMALFLSRGQYAWLERWGGEEFYAPALRHYAAHSPADLDSRTEFYEWMEHRFAPRFPDERVADLSILPGGELALLLRRTDECRERTGLGDECRVVLLDPDRSDLLIAAGERADLNAWRMRWDGDWVLLNGGNSLTISLVCHREGAILRLIPTRMEGQGEPYFWGSSEFEDGDGDGLPQVITTGSHREPCPCCGRILMPREETWKLLDGAFRLWTVQDCWCAAGCTIPRSD
jgi:hypothetical protein